MLMSKPKIPNRTILTVSALIYLLNLCVIATNYFNLTRHIANWIPQSGLSPFYTLADFVSLIASGLLYGQLSCVSLWMSISVVRLKWKMLVWLAVVLQAVFFLGVKDASYLPLHSLWRSFLGHFCTSIILAALTYLGIRFSNGCIHMEKLENKDRLQKKPMLTIAQIFFGTSVIAIALAARLAMRPSLSSGLPNLWLEIIAFSFAISLIPTASLLVAVTLRRLITQIFVCFVLALLVSIIVEEKPSWQMLILQTEIFAWMGVLPVLWLQAARYIGYSVRLVERDADRNSVLTTNQ